MAEEVVLMKGNEAIAHAAIRCGADGYFGYPITPQSEVLETLAELKPWETTGMVVLQAESEVAAINMVYGGAAPGTKATPHRCGSHRTMPMGHYRQNQWPQTQRHHLIGTETGRNGKEQHPFPGQIQADRRE